MTPEQYQQQYKQSIADPDAFWRGQARRLDWFTPPTVIGNASFAPSQIAIKWYEDGVLNACHNCVDRHVPARADQTALIWEPDDPGPSRAITYGELKGEVCRVANALKSLGVTKGDRVTIYMPMVPEAVFAMLACARIGAVHSVVFAGFSPDALAARIRDCASKIILTADEGRRGGKRIPLRENVEAAVKNCAGVETVLLLRNPPPPAPSREGELEGEGAVRRADASAASPALPPLSPLPLRGQGGEVQFVDWHTLISRQSADYPCEPMNAEDPLFILYTSGSTGQPKGLLHTTGGYLVYAAFTHEQSFDYRDGEVYWCTADIGWVTGHSYIVYGPLANGATSLMFEGVPNYPDFSRFWQVVDKHRVNIFYTAPTAIRALLREGDEWVTKTSRDSLRILATVGEPINPEAWRWYHDVIGSGRCPVIDTWWQTETGGHMITPLPGAGPQKPGSAGKPFFGIQPVIVDNDGKELTGEAEGALCIAASWPGQARTIYGDPARFEQTYFSHFAGKYFTGDGARRDADGDYWITGRIDDVINVSGHRLGTAEIEAAINQCAGVAESAVVGFPHDIKGQGIYAYVIPKEGPMKSGGGDALIKDIKQTVRRVIGPIATPDIVQITPGLPKTRSGKIMRRILRKIAAGETDSLGDVSTLADPAIVETLIKNADR